MEFKGVEMEKVNHDKYKRIRSIIPKSTYFIYKDVLMILLACNLSPMAKKMAIIIIEGLLPFLPKEIQIL